jgi:hypothetical protein
MAATANKLIIAAAVVYAAATTFAHADPNNPADPDYMIMPPEHHTAQALSKAHALCAKIEARDPVKLSAADRQFVIGTCVDKNAWRFDRRGG